MCGLQRTETNAINAVSKHTTAHSLIIILIIEHVVEPVDASLDLTGLLIESSDRGRRKSC